MRRCGITDFYMLIRFYFRFVYLHLTDRFLSPYWFIAQGFLLLKGTFSEIEHVRALQSSRETIRIVIDLWENGYLQIEQFKCFKCVCVCEGGSERERNTKLQWFTVELSFSRGTVSLISNKLNITEKSAAWLIHDNWWHKQFMCTTLC